MAALADAEAPHLAAFGVELDRKDVVPPFSLGDPGELTALLTGAGFTDVTIHRPTVDARFPEADRFVERMEFAYAAVVPQFADDPSTLAASLDAINEETADILASYRHGDARPLGTPRQRSHPRRLRQRR